MKYKPLKELLSIVIAALLMSVSSVLSAESQQLIMGRSPETFPEAMSALQEAIKNVGYTVSTVQRVDIGLTGMGFETDKYRVVFFGKANEIKILPQKYPQLAPYLPLAIAIFAEQDELLIQGQVMSLLVAVLLIFSMMLFLWKKVSYALLTMIPNLSPIIGIFILMGIFNIWLDMATAMIASVAIGIAVDDTIHMFHGFKKRLDKGVSTVFALVQSYYKTGRAIVVTTIILCSQFLLLSFSEFIPTAHFGLLTAIGLFMALVFDLLLLPAVIVLFYKK